MIPISEPTKISPRFLPRISYFLGTKFWFCCFVLSFSCSFHWLCIQAGYFATWDCRRRWKRKKIQFLGSTVCWSVVGGAFVVRFGIAMQDGRCDSRVWYVFVQCLYSDMYPKYIYTYIDIFSMLQYMHVMWSIIHTMYMHIDTNWSNCLCWHLYMLAYSRYIVLEQSLHILKRDVPSKGRSCLTYHGPASSTWHYCLGGGFQHALFSPLFGEETHWRVILFCKVAKNLFIPDLPPTQ